MTVGAPLLEVIGSGEWSFAPVVGWPRLPEGLVLGDVAGHAGRHGGRRREGARRPRLECDPRQRRRSRDRSRLHLEPAHGPRGLQEHPRRRAAHRRRSRLAVLPPRALSAAHPQRPDSHRRQLRRRLARARGTSRTERRAHEDGQGLRHDLVGRLHRRLVPCGPARMDRDRPHHARRLACARAARSARHPRGRARPSSGRPAARRQGHHRRLRRGLHGHVQRDLRRRAAQPARHLQGAPVAVGALRRDARGAGCRGRRRLRLAHRPRHDVPLRRGRRDRAHARAGAVAAEDVHRSSAHRRRLRSGRGGYPVPAGPQGPRPRVRPGEGILNSTERPPVFSRDGARELFAGRALPHFNEADEGVAVDALITDRVWTAMGLVPDNTLHDVRWGEDFGGDFVWVYEISGSVPASHLGGWDKAEGWRQGDVFFPAGGATINGVSQPGELVVSRVFIADGILQADIFRASVVELPDAETERRKQATNPEWPIAHVVLHGVSRDQFMARHKANHAQVVYAPDADTADKALVAKAAMFDRIGVKVNLVGDVAL